MTPRLDMEREFFKAVKDCESYDEAREQFMTRMKNISENWIDIKLMMNIKGLKRLSQR